MSGNSTVNFSSRSERLDRCELETSTLIPIESFGDFIYTKELVNFSVEHDGSKYYIKAVYIHTDHPSREYYVDVYFDYPIILEKGFKWKHIGGETFFDDEPLYIDGVESSHRLVKCNGNGKCSKHGYGRMKYWCSFCYGKLPTETEFFTDVEHNVKNIMHYISSYSRSNTESGIPVIDFIRLCNYLDYGYYIFIKDCLSYENENQNYYNQFISKIIFTKLSVNTKKDAQICKNIKLVPFSTTTQKQIDDINLKINNNNTEIARLKIEVENDIQRQKTQQEEKIKSLENERERECSRVDRKYSVEKETLQNLIKNVEQEQKKKYDRHITCAFTEAISNWKTKLINLEKQKSVEIDNIKIKYNQTIKTHSIQQPVSRFTTSINELEIKQISLNNDLNHLYKAK